MDTSRGVRTLLFSVHVRPCDCTAAPGSRTVGRRRRTRRRRRSGRRNEPSDPGTPFPEPESARAPHCSRWLAAMRAKPPSPPQMRPHCSYRRHRQLQRWWRQRRVEWVAAVRTRMPPRGRSQCGRGPRLGSCGQWSCFRSRPGGHEASKVGNPEWQPYSPAVRLGNLQMLDTKFRRAMRKGLLCFKLSESLWQPVQWSVQPTVMPVEQFRQQLALAFDGVREGHEPFRFLASRAVEDLLAAAMTRGSQVAAAVPELVAPLKLCLNTMQPQLVGGLLLLLIRLLRCHPAVPVALAPYCRHLLPGLAVFRSHRRLLELPAPVCLPPTGSFSGSGAPHGSVSRSCRICGVPVYREYEKAAGWELEVPKPLVWGTPEAAAIAQAGLGNKPAAAPAAAVEPSAAAAKRLPGRMCRRYTLESLIEEVLGLMAASGGETASRVIRNYVPGFTYYPPQDQPPCRTVEELLESSKTEKPRRPASSRPQRPRSAPRISGRRPVGASEGGPGGAAGGRNRRPATAGERVKKTAAAGGSWKAGQQHSGGDDGTDRPVPSAADLARWDGIEFRDVPYGLAVEEEQHALDPVEVAGGGSGGRGPGLRPAALHISTPVPVFDSPHDPLYGLLMSSAGFLNGRLVAEGHGTRTASVRPRRGGSGGGAMRASVNTEVPYRSSWAGLRQAI
ncbi:hypothetical protein Vretimale_6449 [Volvox reticuliferus]|uniref:Uncharacterized protein n=1 Tax=Volvox reticuliferus TaxID=1737510 RepID=A0A8J4G7K6_9CHLO|nr:hypothetical protein Vretimale_6449 [Volvox reticuliferus]